MTTRAARAVPNTCGECRYVVELPGATPVRGRLAATCAHPENPNADHGDPFTRVIMREAPPKHGCAIRRKQQAERP